MTIAKLTEIPCIAVKELGMERLIISANDGFHLEVNRIANYWRFNPYSEVFAVEHFDLRRKIHEALNVCDSRSITA